MKFALVTAATCFLGFCIGGDKTPVAEPETSIVPPYAHSSTMYESQFQPTGLLGSYLSANFAQRRFDWNSAYQHMSDVVNASEIDASADSNHYNLYRRAMLVAIGAGEFQDGLALAEKISEEADPESLTIIVKAIHALKNGEYDTVRAAIKSMPDDGLSRFMEPILIGWTDAQQVKTTLGELSGLFAHAFL